MDTGINASKKAIYKAAEATGEFSGNKITDAVAKWYNNKIVKTKPDEEIIMLPEKTEEKLSIIKMEH